jgi:hypothetical protein
MNAIARGAKLLFTTLCLVALISLGRPTFAAGAQSDKMPPSNQGKILHIQDDTDWVRYGRWSAMRQHTMHTYAQFSNEDYCAVFATTVIDEAKDLQSNEGKQMPMMLDGKDLVIILPSGRHLKMHVVKPGECERKS